MNFHPGVANTESGVVFLSPIHPTTRGKKSKCKELSKNKNSQQLREMPGHGAPVCALSVGSRVVSEGRATKEQHVFQTEVPAAQRGGRASGGQGTQGVRKLHTQGSSWQHGVKMKHLDDCSECGHVF